VDAIRDATLNGYLAKFFNRVAFSHFGLRRLEGIYGEEAVQRCYREEMPAVGSYLIPNYSLERTATEFPSERRTYE
jgi:hypothetical protein